MKRKLYVLLAICSISAFVLVACADNNNTRNETLQETQGPTGNQKDMPGGTTVPDGGDDTNNPTGGGNNNGTNGTGGTGGTNGSGPNNNGQNNDGVIDGLENDLEDAGDRLQDGANDANDTLNDATDDNR